MPQVELINVRGDRVLPLINPLAFTQGNIWHVKPYSGNDSNTGKRPDIAFKTLAKALDSATADQNDVVLLYAESNTASLTTDYLSSTLDWNKDMVHLVGVGPYSPMSQRSRIAWLSTASSSSDIPLFTLSADGCIIQNIQFIAALADANMIGALNVTGDRNYIRHCHIAGIGNDTQDAAGAYSLKIDGSEECEIADCNIGLNTIDAGSAANSEILIDGGAKNIIFTDSLIYRRIEHATNHPLVKLADATAMDEFILFRRCGFITTATNYGYTLGGVFKFGATPTQGLVVLDNCYAVNDNAAAAGKWDVDDLDKIAIIGHPTPAADTCGLIRVV